MHTNIMFSLLISASASNVSTSKDYLRHDPMLGGSVIKYCETASPKSCETVDRRKEASPGIGKVEVIKQLGSKLAEISVDFRSLSVQNENLDLSFEFKQSHKPKK